MLSRLSKQELENDLYQLRDLVTGLDYSHISNVTFLNMESFYSYIQTTEGSPFSDHYQEMQKIMDRVEPYLPFAIGKTAIQFLTEAAFIETDQDMERLKAEYIPRARIDFIHLLQNIKTENEWIYILELCESIRKEKEDENI